MNINEGLNDLILSELFSYLKMKREEEVIEALL